MSILRKDDALACRLNGTIVTKPRPLCGLGGQHRKPPANYAEPLRSKPSATPRKRGSVNIDDSVTVIHWLEEMLAKKPPSAEVCEFLEGCIEALAAHALVVDDLLL